MIKTADTDYAADYVTVYERPIMSRYFDRKSEKRQFDAKLLRRPFLVLDHK